MADEPENLTLRLLREMREEIAAKFAENDRQHAETRELLGKVIDTVTTIAMVQEQHTALLQSYGGRLNVIDGRLAIIEKHAGLVKA